MGWVGGGGGLGPVGGLNPKSSAVPSACNTN